MAVAFNMRVEGGMADEQEQLTVTAANRTVKD